jgi:hypothetical protein
LAVYTFFGAAPVGTGVVERGADWSDVDCEESEVGDDVEGAEEAFGEEGLDVVG